MTATLAPMQHHRPRARLAVAGGITMACSVGSLALMTAGHGIAGWAALLAGVLCSTAMQLSRRTPDDDPRGTRWQDFVVTLLGMFAVLFAGGLGARAVAVDHPSLAAVIAVVAGAAAAGLLRRQQLRPRARTA